MKELDELLAYKKKTGTTYSDMSYEMGISQVTLQRWIYRTHKPSKMGMEKIRHYLKIFKKRGKKR